MVLQSGATSYGLAHHGGVENEEMRQKNREDFMTD